jgi:Domain of unknown function (DUF932)
MNVLTNNELYRFAPSIFAMGAHHSTSERYEFIPTIDVVEALRAEGFQPVQAFQAKTRLADRRNFTKHTIRFAHEGHTFKEVNDSRFEILLQNSHVGSSSFQISAGVYRMVCSNGMIIADSILDTHRVRHSGRKATLDNVIEGTYRVVDGVETVEEQVIDWQSRVLEAPVQQAFAKAALQLRWDEDAPIAPHQLLQPRRWADRGEDQWRVFNRVQEAIIRGGNSGVGSTGRRTTTREVKSIDENNRLNKALWTLSTELENLLKA